ncbi:rRNA maturation RNase YbeY [Roseibacillus persicicus]|uniref:rRNA maturation RNase YbeY n=1 Tax=Roseibacillus persicicus TaxID=454148 RepID=UPI00398A5450
MARPTVELFVHCQGGLSGEDLEWLEHQVEPALLEVLASYPGSELEQLDELELSLVDDATLAGIHGDFLDDPTVTDVITFPHGEILVSVEMAARRAEEFGKGERGETFLYLIHGMLHLAGLDDRTEEDAAVMAKEQERIWAKLTA